MTPSFLSNLDLGQLDILKGLHERDCFMWRHIVPSILDDRFTVLDSPLEMQGLKVTFDHWHEAAHSDVDRAMLSQAVTVVPYRRSQAHYAILVRGTEPRDFERNEIGSELVC